MNLLDRIFDRATVPDSAVEYCMDHPDVELTLVYDKADHAIRVTMTNGLRRASTASDITDVMTAGKDGSGVNAFWLAPLLGHLEKAAGLR